MPPTTRAYHPLQIPQGYEWMEDVIAREKDVDSNNDTAYDTALDPDPVTVGRTLVFEMPKDPDWDDLDEATKMVRKRNYLCERYNPINLIFEEDPTESRNMNGRVFVPKNDYYALHEVWDCPNSGIQYHMSMTLLEHGFGLTGDAFKRLQKNLLKSAFERMARRDLVRRRAEMAHRLRHNLASSQRAQHQAAMGRNISGPSILGSSSDVQLACGMDPRTMARVSSI